MAFDWSNILWFTNQSQADPQLLKDIYFSCQKTWHPLLFSLKSPFQKNKQSSSKKIPHNTPLSSMSDPSWKRASVINCVNSGMESQVHVPSKNSELLTWLLRNQSPKSNKLQNGNTHWDKFLPMAMIHCTRTNTAVYIFTTTLQFWVIIHQHFLSNIHRRKKCKSFVINL